MDLCKFGAEYVHRFMSRNLVVFGHLHSCSYTSCSISSLYVYDYVQFYYTTHAFMVANLLMSLQYISQFFFSSLTPTASFRRGCAFWACRAVIGVQSVGRPSRFAFDTTQPLHVRDRSIEWLYRPGFPINRIQEMCSWNLLFYEGYCPKLRLRLMPRPAPHERLRHDNSQYLGAIWATLSSWCIVNSSKGHGVLTAMLYGCHLANECPKCAIMDRRRRE
jgi:hypothetical protein